MDEVKGNLQDAQKKVDNSKAEITRIKNELMPLEVGVALWVWLCGVTNAVIVSTARTH